MGNVSNIIETQYMFGEKKTREEGMGGGGIQRHSKFSSESMELGVRGPSSEAWLCLIY